MARLDFDTMVRDFVDNQYKDVQCPEYTGPDGNPTTIRFRTKLTVADLEWLLAHEGASPELERAQLFYLLAVDEKHEPFVPRRGDERHDQWLTKVDVTKATTIVMRAELEKEVYAQLIGEERKEMMGNDLLGGVRPASMVSRGGQLRDLLRSGVQLPDSPSKADGSLPQSEDGQSATTATS